MNYCDYLAPYLFFFSTAASNAMIISLKTVFLLHLHFFRAIFYLPYKIAYQKIPANVTQLQYSPLLFAFGKVGILLIVCIEVPDLFSLLLRSSPVEFGELINVLVSLTYRLGHIAFQLYLPLQHRLLARISNSLLSMIDTSERLPWTPLVGWIVNFSIFSTMLGWGSSRFWLYTSMMILRIVCYTHHILYVDLSIRILSKFIRRSTMITLSGVIQNLRKKDGARRNLKPPAFEDLKHYLRQTETIKLESWQLLLIRQSLEKVDKTYRNLISYVRFPIIVILATDMMENIFSVAMIAKSYRAILNLPYLLCSFTRIIFILNAPALLQKTVRNHFH